MTEKQWLTTKDVYNLTHHKSGRSERKRRLLMIAYARRVVHFLPDPLFAAALDECERFAEGEIDWAAMLVVRKLVRAAADGMPPALLELNEHVINAVAAVRCVTEKAFMSYKMTAESAAAAVAAAARPKWDRGHDAERAVQLQLARDVFANPFRPISLQPASRTSTVVGLAEGIYADRAFDRLPILADALQDAGCEDADILSHCRGDGPHVRGCWVVDLMLGKS